MGHDSEVQTSSATRNRFKRILFATVCAMSGLSLGLMAPPSWAQAQIATTPGEARAIAREAYVYGFPIIDHYRIQYAYFVDTSNPEYKAPWNQIKNVPRVFTPDDKAIQTPNSNTPYSFIGFDLRAEPIALTVPTIEKECYYNIKPNQLKGRNRERILRNREERNENENCNSTYTRRFAIVCPDLRADV